MKPPASAWKLPTFTRPYIHEPTPLKIGWPGNNIVENLANLSATITGDRGEFAKIPRKKEPKPKSGDAEEMEKNEEEKGAQEEEGEEREEDEEIFLFEF